MRESKISYHRLVDCQDHVAFTTEDGINVFGGSAAIQKCLNCGYTELPIEVKEIIDPGISEKRKNPQSPTQLYTITRNLL
jgi:hypothetical protein